MLELKPKYKVVMKEGSDHFYTVEGSDNWRMGVTTPLECCPKPFLKPWAAKLTAEYLRPWVLGENPSVKTKKEAEEIIKVAKAEYKRVSKEATTIGTKLHAFADLYINKKQGPKEDLGILEKGFMSWVETEKPNFLLGDTKVLSLEHSFGGSIDIAIEENNRVVIIDLKTSKAIDPSHILQGSAYSVAFKETYGLSYLPDFRVVRIEKDKEKVEKTGVLYEQGFATNLEMSFETFLSALNLYKNLSKDHYALSR